MRRGCARTLGLSLLAIGLAAPTSAQSVTWFQFDPSVVPSTWTGPVLLEAAITGQPSRVSLVLASGDTLDLKDDGTSGDRQPGDGTFTVSVPVSAIVGVMTANDVQRPFVGYLDVYSGTNRVLRGNMFADVYTPDIAQVPITPISSQVQWTQHLVNIVDPIYAVGGSATTVASAFYNSFNDDEDFLNIVSVPSRFLNRDHVVVRNDVAGIGAAMKDTTADYGSNGRLRGFSRFPIGYFYDGANTGYVHETGHQWISYLDFQPFATGVPHWPISTMATGTMGFSAGGAGGEGSTFPCTFTDNNGTVTLTPTTAQPVFNDLDLYLMGLLTASGVHTQYVFPGLSNPPQCSSVPYTGTTTAVGVNTIVAAAGTRVPDVSTSPKHFRAATILVTRDRLASPEAMWFYSWLTTRAELQSSVPIHEGFVKAIGNPFFVSTRGLATLDTTITPPAPDFSLVVANPVQQVTHGGTATFQMSVLPKHGPFNAAVSLTCSVQPVLPCSFDRPSVEPGDTGADLTLTVRTEATAVADLGPIGASSGLGLIALLVSGSSRRRRIAGVVTLVILVASCGGGTPPVTPTPSPTPTPAPTNYRISIAGTAGVLTHTATLTLVVQ